MAASSFLHRWSSPAHWPIVERGLLLADVKGVFCFGTSSELTSEQFQRLKIELDAALGARGNVAIPVLVHVPRPTKLTASERLEIARIFERHSAKLMQTTSACAFVLPSPYTRGVLRAIFWMAPPPYPWKVCDTVHDALTYLAQYSREMDIARVEGAYRTLARQTFGLW